MSWIDVFKLDQWTGIVVAFWCPVDNIWHSLGRSGFSFSDALELCSNRWSAKAQKPFQCMFKMSQIFSYELRNPILVATFFLLWLINTDTILCSPVVWIRKIINQVQLLIIWQFEPLAFRNKNNSILLISLVCFFNCKPLPMAIDVGNF